MLTQQPGLWPHLSLWSCGFPALPEKPILPSPASLEAEKASLGALPGQCGWKCKSAVPAPFTRGLPLPAAALSGEQSCSQLCSASPKKQHRLEPSHIPLEVLGRGCSPASRGLWDAASAEISGGILAAPLQVQLQAACARPTAVWPWEEVPQHPPTASLLMGLFLLEAEEKVFLWLFVMEGAVVGEKGVPEVVLWQPLSPVPSSWGCADIAALCSCSNTLKA